MRLIEGWQKLLAPLLFGAKLQNLQADAAARTCRASSRRRRVLPRAARARLPVRTHRLHDGARRSPRRQAARRERPRPFRREHRTPRVAPRRARSRRDAYLGLLAARTTRRRRAAFAPWASHRDVGPFGARGRRASASTDSVRRAAALDCGNSGATLRPSVRRPRRAAFSHDARRRRALLRQPVTRVAAPSARAGRGHRWDAAPERDGEITAPLRVGPRIDGRRLAGLEFESPIASAQVKSAVLLSGLFAEGLDALQGADRLARPHRADARRAGRSDSHRGPVVQLDLGAGTAGSPPSSCRSPATSRRPRSSSPRRRLSRVRA